ncbi:MAG: SRPBCC domain-containing protein [Phycisphaeraceae bacterium]|nr:MAG: SRPBCC domain-containing protein [Phycisphaeraceae bacterium]
MVFRQVGLASVASRDSHADGWNSAFENLGGVCGAVPPADTSGLSLKVETPTDTTIVMTRSFRSPRETVWRAMTEPGLLRRWLFSPPGWMMTACEGGAVVGGAYRWAWDDAEGNPALSIHGVWTEVRPPWRVAHTETMEAGACGVVGSLVATIELAEAAGETVLTITLEFGSKEARDGALASGMDRGMEAGYAALDNALRDF